MPGSLAAAIFDMDGTLFDTLGPVTDGFIDTILAAGGPRYTPVEIVESFRFGPPRRMLDHLLGRPCADDEVGEYHRRLSETAQGTTPYPGIPEALDDVRNAGLRLALFTGADVPSLTLLLAGTGLRAHFELVTGGDEVTRAKPAPDGILLTCHRLQLPPHLTAYVGDSGPDMGAARAAGVLAVGAAWGDLWDPTHPADVVAHRPADLGQLLSNA